MGIKAILLDTSDYSDRPRDPAPTASMRREMQEYCKRNNYTIVAELNSNQKYLYEKNTELSKIVIENSLASDNIVIVKLGKNYEQVEGETIDPKLAQLVSEQRLKCEPIEHPCVSPPNDGNTRIWRYLNLPKFVDLLQSNCLHFTRVDEMRRYDASEGVSSTIAMKRIVQQVSENKIDSPIPDLTRAQFLQVSGSSQSDDLLNKVHFINCWHMSEHENFAMWKVYSEPFGVCIESRFDDLKNCFIDEKWDYYASRHKVYIGRVDYIDSETQFIRRDNSFWTYLTKRREYSYENELRCVIAEWEQPKFARPKVDLGCLIRKIKLNPEAPSWYHASMVDLCQKYGIDPRIVVPSALSEN